jgi:tetratricopeptide (TPR) repeat protein
MKQFFILFTFILTAFTLTARAQTGTGVDSIKPQILAALPDSIKPAANQNTPAPDTSKRLADNLGPRVILYKNYVKVEPAAVIPFTTASDAEMQATLVKKITPLIAPFFAADTVNELIQRMPGSIVDLKKQISLVTNDTLRALYYQKIANYYLKYDSISLKRTRTVYQDAAIEYTIKALHSYSRYNDSNGLRNSFNNLVRVYKDQKKFSQAKWCILQSNTISRMQNDTRNVISSLVELAGIKMSIKDYKLAQRDLDEALSLSSQNHFSKQESMVQTSYVSLYTHLNNPQKAAAALKRHDFIEDSIVKAEQARTLAALKAQDSTQQAKKKLLTSVTSVSKKSLKANSAKRTASL